MPYVVADDGFKVWFEEQGDGVPVVLVHEFGGDRCSWSCQLPALSPQFRCVTYAARGFYPSDVPPSTASYGQERATRDLLNILDHLKIDSAHIVGTSMGSFTSLDFLLEHGCRVLSLTLIGNSSGPRNSTERESYRADWLLPDIEQRLSLGGAGAVAQLTHDSAYQSFQRNSPYGWQRYCARLASQSVEGALNILRTVHWNRRSLWEDEARLREIQCPVLLVYGDEDNYLVRETNNYLNGHIPYSKLEVFAETGHLVNIEQSQKFNDLLVKHLTAVRGEVTNTANLFSVS